MKLSTTLVAASCLFAAASSSLARQPAPAPELRQDLLPAPQYDGEMLYDPTNEDTFWLPPPKPPLPYGFTWDNYMGAEIEHDLYGYQRLNPPPRRTASCYGWVAGIADSVHVMFSYPTDNRPPPMHCVKQHGRCVPAKMSFGHRCHSGGGSCPCQAHSAPVMLAPVTVAPYVPNFPTPEPSYEPEPHPIVQPRAVPVSPQVRPLVPPVLIDDAQPAPPLLEPGDPRPPAIAPGPPPPVLTEEPALPRNTVPPVNALPRNRIPARAGGR
jgi:hypothetical protein